MDTHIFDRSLKLQHQLLCKDAAEATSGSRELCGLRDRGPCAGGTNDMLC